MPPDRTHTTSSFSEALKSGAPLSSSGAGHPPSLERGKACVTCRRRRVKCDGARPVCGRCAKSAQALGEDPATFTCEYKAPRKPVAVLSAGQTRATLAEGSKTGTSAGAPKKQEDKVRKLADEVAALKQQLLSYTASTSSSTAGPGASVPQPHAVATQPSYAPSAAAENSYPYPSAQPSQSDPSAPSTSTFSPPDRSPNPAQFDFSQPESSSSYNDTSLSDCAVATNRSPLPPPSLEDLLAAASASASSDLFDPFATTPSLTLPLDLSLDFSFALLPPGYPSSLPSPSLLSNLIDVFFQKSHLATGLISEPKLRSALLLPPSHKGYPLEGLLHAVCATAGLMVGEGMLEGEWIRYWEDEGQGGGRGREGFSRWHAMKAEALIDPSFTAGRHLLQVVQTAALCTFCAYTSARFTAIWSLSVRASRLAIVCNLNHLRPPRSSSSSYTSQHAAAQANEGTRGNGRRAKEPAILPPPKDQEEYNERARVFWAVFGSDRMTAAATDWAPTISEEDVTSLLPAPEEMSAGGTGGGMAEWASHPLSSPLCPLSPSFFFANPPHLVSSLQLYAKANILLGRVCTFLQRAPEPIGSGYPALEGDGAGADLRETPAFRSLLSTVSHFRLSIPRELQYRYVLHTQGRIDPRLLMVESLGWVCGILMLEP
ncbi:hypothetical protein JCM11641_001068, partial [Rhodosporidiobolus odoratus]